MTANVVLICIYSTVVITIVTFQSHKEVNENSEFIRYKLRSQINIKYCDNDPKYVCMLLIASTNIKNEIQKVLGNKKENEIKNEVDKLI